MSTERQAGIEWVQTVPVRMTIDVHQVKPRRPVLSEAPLVTVRGVVDLNPSKLRKDLPLWFKAVVQVYEDGTSGIKSFSPLHGVVHGPQIGGQLIAIYRHAFSRSLVDTKLKILDVVKK